MKIFRCHKISDGKAEGEILVSVDPLCFYLVDPKTGVVIEKNHSLYGKCIAGKILVFPNGKGSSVVQADGMYQLKMKGNEPKAMLVQNPDTTLVASAIIMKIPLADSVEPEFYSLAKDGDAAVIDTDAETVTWKEGNR